MAFLIAELIRDKRIDKSTRERRRRPKASCSRKSEKAWGACECGADGREGR